MHPRSLLSVQRRHAMPAAVAARACATSQPNPLHCAGEHAEKRSRRPLPFRRTLRSLLCWLGALFAVAAVVFSAQARVAMGQETGVTEYQVKAAFLYNFAKFIEWPDAAFPDRAAPFRLCVLGEQAYFAASGSLAGKSVQGRVLDIRRVDSVGDARACHLLFVAREESAWAEATLAEIDGYTLSVGETSGFTINGGVINLVRVDDRVRFQIARRVGERAGFKFNAQLLNLATLVDHDQ